MIEIVGLLSLLLFVMVGFFLRGKMMQLFRVIRTSNHGEYSVRQWFAIWGTAFVIFVVAEFVFLMMFI